MRSRRSRRSTNSRRSRRSTNSRRSRRSNRRRNSRRSNRVRRKNIRGGSEQEKSRTRTAISNAGVKDKGFAENVIENNFFVGTKVATSGVPFRNEKIGIVTGYTADKKITVNWDHTLGPTVSQTFGGPALTPKLRWTSSIDGKTNVRLGEIYKID